MKTLIVVLGFVATKIAVPLIKMAVVAVFTLAMFALKMMVSTILNVR